MNETENALNWLPMLLQFFQKRKRKKRNFIRTQPSLAVAINKNIFRAN